MKNCHAEDVLKTFSRHVFKMSSRRLQDQQMFAGQVDTKFMKLENRKNRQATRTFTKSQEAKLI